MQTMNEKKAPSPTSAIRKKIGKNVNMHDVFSPEKIKECDAIIERANNEFLKEALGIWQSIIHDFGDLYANPDASLPILKKITKSSLEIKGKLDAIGYGLGMKIAKSLHDFAEKDCVPQKHMVIYGKHIDAMNTVIRSNLKGDGGAIGSEIMKALAILIKKLA